MARMVNIEILRMEKVLEEIETIGNQEEMIFRRMVSKNQKTKHRRRMSQKKKNKKEPVAEKNKKARNHQRKNEERKEQARLDELDRQKKLEQHRRNIPEREAAWAQSHANNAWENKKATNGISKPAAAAPAPVARVPRVPRRGRVLPRQPRRLVLHVVLGVRQLVQQPLLDVAERRERARVPLKVRLRRARGPCAAGPAA